MASFPARALRFRADTALTALALGLLDEAEGALARIPDDAEGLHDFRVALRRLRSLTRGYREFLHPRLGKKGTRGWRDLAAATNAGRDAEVMAAWVRETIPSLATRQRRDARWMAERLEARRAAEYETVQSDVRRRFAKLARRARKDLTAGPDAGPPHTAPALATAAADAITAAAKDLRERLAAVDAPRDRGAAHGARIAVKRLRYLLEPLPGRARGARTLVRECKRLQDLLGDLDLCHALDEELIAAVEASAAARARHQLERALDEPAAPRIARPRARSGLLALAQRVRARRAELFGRLQEEWLAERAPRLASEAERIARELRDARLPSAPPPPAAAPARRYRRPARTPWQARHTAAGA